MIVLHTVGISPLVHRLAERQDLVRACLLQVLNQRRLAAADVALWNNKAISSIRGM